MKSWCGFIYNMHQITLTLSKHCINRVSRSINDSCIQLYCKLKHVLCLQVMLFLSYTVSSIGDSYFIKKSQEKLYNFHLGDNKSSPTLTSIISRVH